MPKNNACFICGTDTDVGKTLVCAGLLINKPDISVLKIIQTGQELFDQHTYLEAKPQAKVKTLKHFSVPASPHLSAKLSNKRLTLQALYDGIQEEVKQDKLTLIESSGGLLTPINETETFLDLISLMPYPVILVVKNTLGAINHCLLSVKALQSQGVSIMGLIFTHPKVESEEETLIATDNIKILAAMTGLPVLDSIPFIAEFSAKNQQQEAWYKLASHLKNTTNELNRLSNAEHENIGLFDQQHLWHPYSKTVSPPENWPVESAKGCHIYLQDGRSLVDGMSSWWSAIHGYGHPTLTRALNQQAGKMSHMMFGGLTHAPAVKLGEALLAILPKGLSNIFYADSGSVAVEVALKMACQYWQAQGFSNKTKFISFAGGYHGDTFGAMSVCDPVNGMHTLFNGLLNQNIFIPRPDAPFDRPFNPSSLDELKRIVEEHQHECAAIILEPIVQGAGGMWIYHPDYLKAVKAICEQHNILLILDEIATGFGRTGKLFAANWADISPDIMCIGKALTGGVMSLAASITTKKIAEGISAKGDVLMHGPTFMANPLACSVALANINLLLSSNWQENVLRIEAILKTELSQCCTDPSVADVRILGAIGVVEMRQKVNVEKLQRYFVDHCGVWIRPFNHLIYIMPPFTIEPEEVLILVRAIKSAIAEQAWV